MKMSAMTAVSLLLAYQDWCGERIVTVYRAEQVIGGLTALLIKNKSKAAAARWLKDDGWADSLADATRLVNAVWPLRETVMAEYTSFAAARVLGTL